MKRSRHRLAQVYSNEFGEMNRGSWDLSASSPSSRSRDSSRTPSSSSLFIMIIGDYDQSFGYEQKLDPTQWYDTQLHLLSPSSTLLFNPPYRPPTSFKRLLILFLGPPDNLPVKIRQNPSKSVKICQNTSKYVIIRHYPSLSVIIRHYLSLSVIIRQNPSISVKCMENKQKLAKLTIFENMRLWGSKMEL